MPPSPVGVGYRTEGDGERWQRKEVGYAIELLPFDFRAHSTPHQGGGPNGDENYSEPHVQALVGVVCGQDQEVEVTGAIQGQGACDSILDASVDFIPTQGISVGNEQIRIKAVQKK